MIRQYQETFIDMVGLFFHPFRTFERINRKSISWCPLFLAAFLICTCSTLSVGYLRYRGAQVLANPAAYPWWSDSLSNLEQTLSINLGRLCVSFAVAPIISITTTGIFMFILSAMGKAITSFKQNVILSAYAWTPMVLASIITTVLVFILPIERSMFTSSMCDLLIPVSYQNSSIFIILRQIDLFYLWSLFLLATGARRLHEKSGIGWYVAVFAVMGLPMFLRLVG